MNFRSLYIAVFTIVVAGLILCKITGDIKAGARQRLASTEAAAAAYNSRVISDQNAARAFADADARRARDRQTADRLGMSYEDFKRYSK